MESPDVVQSFDTILEALSDVQRRRLLLTLAEENPLTESPEMLADELGGSEPDEQYIRMRHIHLPKLESYGFVDWDRDEREVRKGPNFDEIYPVLALLDTHQEDLPADWR